MAPLPIKLGEIVQLTSIGIDSQAIGFNSCVRLSRCDACLRFFACSGRAELGGHFAWLGKTIVPLDPTANSPYRH